LRAPLALTGALVGCVCPGGRLRGGRNECGWFGYAGIRHTSLSIVFSGHVVTP